LANGNAAAIRVPCPRRLIDRLDVNAADGLDAAADLRDLGAAFCDRQGSIRANARGGEFENKPGLRVRAVAEVPDALY
jgi:hypothetical protein